MTDLVTLSRVQLDRIRKAYGGHLDAVKHRSPCPVCGKRGWRKISRRYGRVMFWCRAGHPYYISGEE